ncbi:MAG: ABC transporter permease [Bryobacteraceae bacterium]|jgi:lipopolysaccharide transport system permease protein
MKAAWSDVRTAASGLKLTVDLALANRAGFIGWQFYDPDTNRFIQEGEWTPAAATSLTIEFPPEPGGYRIYLSTVSAEEGWAYMRGEPFVVVDAVVDRAGDNPAVRVLSHQICTLRRLRWRSFRRAFPKLFTAPVASLWRNRMLLRSMVKRDILTRYRGSVGDVFWTVLNPLLLMLTYYFVFGVVLRTRFGADRSGSAYVLYFLAGMLPWLAFSEAAGRAPYIILEHRNWVKKLVFPLEILPAIPVVSGIVTEVFAVIIFVTALFALHGHVPLTAFWLPALVIPQILFTVGLAWFLAALAVYMRDLGQINGFLLTLWFFLTPICYPVTAMPKGALTVLGKNPMFVLVQAYRSVLLDGHAPEALPLVKLWMLALVFFFAGHAWFYKLRKTFADII